MFKYILDHSKYLNNHYRIFFTIKKKSNEILFKYDDVNYLDDPSISINAIALENGISEILLVPPKDVDYGHALLDDRDKDCIKIKINNEDSVEEQNFSIAHELEHYLRKRADKLKNSDVFKDLDSTAKNSFLTNADTFKNYNKFNGLEARTGGNYKKAIRIVKRIKGAKYISRLIAEIVSRNLGKEVSVEKVYAELAKQLVDTESIPKKNEKFLVDIINKLYNEEVADYFAANVLVPYERFLYWKDKPDGKIAKKFKVTKACIKKRRKEFKHELDFMTSVRLMPGDKV
jgi:hypothetical protein